MSDAVELMEFWPVDADENIGFVAADSDFQLWLLDGIGISFDDISYSVIDGPDNSGIYELVLDYEDYTTLNELYASYLGDNEYASEEGQSPIMDPMDFGEPVNWTPLDGTPSLKRRKDAEADRECNVCDSDIQSFCEKCRNHKGSCCRCVGSSDWEEMQQEFPEVPYGAEDEPLFKTQKEIDEHKQWLKESKEKFPEGEVRVVGRDKIDKRSALGKMMSRWDATTQKEDYAYLGPIEWLDDAKSTTLPYTPRESGELFGPSSDDEDARDEWNDKMGVCLHDWQDDKLEITGKGYDRSYDITAYCPTCDTTVLITYIHYDSDKTETIFLPGKLSASDFYDSSPPIAKFNAVEGANPSGGATGDQIISWEHNGLSSPSGPPSDIMWAESDNFIWCAYCDDLITDDYYFTDGKTVHVDCNLKDSGDAETFDAHSLHRFTQKDSRPMDIGITRQKIKKEMFSEVSSFMTLKNLAVLTAAGMAGYLIAGRK